MNNYSTAKEALEACLKIWIYLAETGADNKEDAYLAVGLVPWTDMHNCPACEYDGPNGCDICPLYPENSKGGCRTLCEDIGQPYREWQRSRAITPRVRAAKDMISLIEKRLGELE